MTSLEYMWIDLYMAALVLILYFLGCRGKTEKGTSLWYYKYSLFIQFVVLMTDSGMWFIEEMRMGLFLVYEFLWSPNQALYHLTPHHTPVHVPYPDRSEDTARPRDTAL